MSISGSEEEDAGQILRRLLCRLINTRFSALPRGLEDIFADHFVGYFVAACSLFHWMRKGRGEGQPESGVAYPSAQPETFESGTLSEYAPLMNRCFWARTELGIAYHDAEWGVPQHKDQTLFEFLILEGAQAGLSWETILKKRDNYRLAFDNFDSRAVAKYDAKKVKALLANPGIIRNRLKVAAAVQNARAFLEVQSEFGTFDAYIWKFVDGRPKQNRWASFKEIPARTSESDAMSKDLRKRGFKFVGSTICYALMQAVGMVNDHTVDCFRYREVARLA